MKRKRLWKYAALLMVSGMTIATSCTGGDAQKTMNGVLEQPVVVAMPEQVANAYGKAVKVHPFDLLNDTVNNICVQGIGELDDGISTEGFGVMVSKNATSTLFKDIRNTRQPRAFYDQPTNSLWLTSCVVEGTGTNVEQLYKMQFGTADDSARVVAVVEPYQMQQQLTAHLTFSVDGQKVTFYADGVAIASATNTVTDMGGFDDEQPLWIGEQISYQLDAQPRVCFVPGLKFTTGLVLTYDDMPTLSAGVTLNDDGSFSLSDFREEKEQ